MKKTLNLIIHYSILIIIFLLPLFFLPTTEEFFITNKLYLLAFASLFLLLLSTVQNLISKKISWYSLNLDKPIILFLLTIGLSILISSPNKIQALLNPNFGLLSILSLTILYFYLSRLSFFTNPSLTYSIAFSSLIVSLLTIIFFFQPFKNVNLPSNLQFLKSPSFTPLGNQVDLAIFLGFFLVLGLTRILEKRNVADKESIFNFGLLTFSLIAFFLTLYSLLKPTSNNYNQFQQILTMLPPFRLCWFAAVEVLKNPLTAAFGVGIDNFSSIFTQVKDLAYNQSPLWQIHSFNVSRSTFLHILTETGIFGFVAFCLLLSSVFKQLISTNLNKSLLILFGYLLICLLIFPPSFITFFLLFIFLSQISSINHQLLSVKSKYFDLSEIPPLYFGITIVSFTLIIGTGYLLGRSYAAEYFFKKSLDGFYKNNGKQAYENLRQAIILNPYIERFRINFSQINLIIANNIAAKANQPQEKDKKPQSLTEQDRQNITQAIQAAIAESKATITLNPQKAGNWENLALVYRNIINTAQGADVWSISAYQRAIVADPQNPIYRLNLGGLYYSLGNYEEAVKLFEQAVILKPDWANAHYNLAWADYQRQNYQRAVSGMQNVLSLLNPQKDKADYEKAQKDLEEFKKKIPKEEAEATKNKEPSKLNLPTPLSATLEPKIKLPNEASPEAK